MSRVYDIDEKVEKYRGYMYKTIYVTSHNGKSVYMEYTWPHMQG